MEGEEVERERKKGGRMDGREKRKKNNLDGHSGFSVAYTYLPMLLMAFKPIYTAFSIAYIRIWPHTCVNPSAEICEINAKFSQPTI